MLPNSCFAQNIQTVNYTVKDGLPSNSLYRTILDKKGYLWIATEIGLSRFDGKKFKNYSTLDGLSDNEITHLFIDSIGTVWAIPFQRQPCYYNEITDKFENEETDKELSKIILEPFYRSCVLKHSGILFFNNQGVYSFYNNKKTNIFTTDLTKKIVFPASTIEYDKNKFLFFSKDSIRKLTNGILTSELPINKKILICESLNSYVYVVTDRSIFLYQFDKNGYVQLLKEKTFPFELMIFCKTKNRIAITSITGITYMLNKNTLQVENVITAAKGMHVRNIQEDKYNNIWLSTMDNGLIKVQQRKISSLNEPQFQQSFTTIIKTNNLIVGNNNGEIYLYDGKVKKILLDSSKNFNGWVRKIVSTKYGLYVAAQSASFLIDEKKLLIKKRFAGIENYSSKSVYKINDSILLLGSHVYTYLYNVKENKLIDSIAKRVSCFGVDATGNIYIGSNKGLYMWHQKKLISFGNIRKCLSNKINAITCSPDSLVWIGLGTDSLIILGKNNWIGAIPMGDIIPGNLCKTLYCNKVGEIWLGTNKGLNKIAYKQPRSGFIYNNTYLGVADGLIGEQVNDISIKDSIVYIATNAGINYLPTNIQFPVSDIPTFISNIFINGKQINLSEKYILKYYENDINIIFSGIDLSGFIPFFEYSINGGKWQRTEKIELQKLAPGNYTVKIHAIRRDGKPSLQKATIEFIINVPFWKNNFFWLSIVTICVSTLLYIQKKINKKKQKKVIETFTIEKRIIELEMQALKAQINPHFIFNCLNSVKGFIYEKDFEQADKYLDKFSELMRATIDNSDASIITLKNEIIYLDNYLQLEKLRFENKFNYIINTHLNKKSNDNIFVPAMLLQPYVENAIRHGMRFLETHTGLIIINLKEEDNFLFCEIDDNGIGRKKAAALKSKLHIEYQSKGMSISKRRAELYNIEQTIIDKETLLNKATGTIIILKIPLQLKTN